MLPREANLMLTRKQVVLRKQIVLKHGLCPIEFGDKGSLLDEDGITELLLTNLTPRIEFFGYINDLIF